MKPTFALLTYFVFASCASTQYQSPAHYYRQRMSEDAIDWGPSSRNNILDSQDDSTYHNRTVEIFGATY